MATCGTLDGWPGLHGVSSSPSAPPPSLPALNTFLLLDSDSGITVPCFFTFKRAGGKAGGSGDLSCAFPLATCHEQVAGEGGSDSGSGVSAIATVDG
jgi:hypothetical protein